MGYDGHRSVEHRLALGYGGRRPASTHPERGSYDHECCNSREIRYRYRLGRIFSRNFTLAGTYTVLITRAGFKQLLVESAPVSVGSDLGLGELQLNIGETSTTITVRSASGLVERTEAQLSESFGTDRLTSLRHSGK